LPPRWQRALECQLREASLPQGETIFGRSQLARRYIALGRFSEAKTTLETAISKEMENTTIHWNLYVIAFLDGDEAAMKRHADWVEAHPDDFGGMEDIRIREAYISGRLQEARGLLEDWVFILQQQNRDENAANMLGRYA